MPTGLIFLSAQWGEREGPGAERWEGEVGALERPWNPPPHPASPPPGAERRFCSQIERDQMIRSFLFVPADSERKLARGLDSGADALILDLEDSVAAANRPTARRQAREFLDAHGSEEIARYVRINPLNSGLALDDLAATVAGRPDGVLLPKCVPEDVRTLDHYLSAFEAAAGHPVGGIRIVAIATETARAVFELGNYAGSSPRLEAVTWGAEDLSADIGGNNRTAGGVYDGPYQLARSLCLLAASAAGVAALDTIYTDFRDEGGLKAEAVAARRSGFTGKMAIHPAQLATINEVFSTSAEEREWAERVIAAFATSPDAGTLALDGKMIDKPHLVLARRLLGLPPS
jgi:citrate lyase subunit beta/citryl-CoA lyase